MCKDCPHPCALFPASPNRQEKGRERRPKPGIIIATSQPRRARARGTEKKPRRRHKGEPRVCPRQEQGWTRRSRSRRGARDEEKRRKREKGGGDGKGIQNKENERKAEQEEERETRTCGRDRKSKRGTLARRRGRGGRGHPEGARGDAGDRGALGPRGSRRAFLWAPLPAAAVGAAAFLRVSHTLAIKESPKPRLFPRPSPARAGEAIFHPLLVFNLLWGKESGFCWARGCARGRGGGAGDCVSPQLRAPGRPGGAAGARAGKAPPRSGRARVGRRGAGADGRGRSTRPGMGPAGARGAGGRVAGAEGVEEKGHPGAQAHCSLGPVLQLAPRLGEDGHTRKGHLGRRLHTRRRSYTQAGGHENSGDAPHF